MCCCWYKSIRQKTTKLCVCEQVRATAVMPANRKEKYYSNSLLPSGKCVCVYMRYLKGSELYSVWVCVRARLYHGAVSVEVVSARRGNLLYKRRADVSYVYPRSHSTKEPCIPNHFNPRPSLSWFSDINNFLFHFPPYIPPLLFFSARHSQQCEQRKVLGNRFWFLIILCEREPVLKKDAMAHNHQRWPAAAVMMFPQWAGAPSCASGDKTTHAGGTAGTALLWEMTLPCSNSFGLAPVGKLRASWRATAAKWISPAEWPLGQTRMNLGPSHPTTQWEV